MCLLVVKPAGVDLPVDFEQAVHNAHSSNEDGFGFASGTQRYRSITLEPKGMIQMLNKYVVKDKPAIIHWRYATAGYIDRDNCHPFRLNDGTLFAHNGICEGHYPSSDGLSDTAKLALASQDFEDLYRRCDAIASSGNKFAMIDPSGNSVSIVGEQFGSWVNGIWFSNSTWMTRKYTLSYTRDDQYYEDLFKNQYEPSVGYGDTHSTDYVELQTQIRDLIVKFGLDACEEVFLIERTAHI